MEKRSIAYTGDDLIAIGEAVNRVTQNLVAFDFLGSDDSEVADDVYNLRVEITHEDFIVGYVGYEDGWLGFRPYPINDYFNDAIWTNEKENNE